MAEKMTSVKINHQIDAAGADIDATDENSAVSERVESGSHRAQNVRPMLQPSGAFAQPSFASPSGAFAQPSFASPSGIFTQPSFSVPPGALEQEDFVDDGATIERFGKQEDEEISSKYDVGEQVGRGGCAVVLEAWRKTDRMHVVIKILQVSTGYDSQEAKVAVKRFYREAELIASLNDEHIVRCIDYGRYQGTPCMVLEFVEGLSLDKLLQNYGALPLTFATGIIQQLLGALVETHEKNIIHRDIKPGNIMVFDTPPPYEIRVLDFGISTVLDNLQSQTLMTQQGNVRGTPSYMAPELFTGETRASAESDLYAVGLVYLECLTGEVAVSDKSFMRVAYKQVNEELEIPLFIPNGIADIIRKLCKKKKEDRYHTAQEVLNDINANLQQAIKDEEKCLKAYQKSLKKKNNKKKSSNTSFNQPTVQKQLKSIMAIGAVIVALLLVIGIGLWLFLHNDDNKMDTPPVVEVVKTPEELEAERLQTVKQHVQNANRLVGWTWNSACADVEKLEQENDENKEEKTKETDKPKSETKSKSKKSTSSRTRKSSNSGGKLVDPSSMLDLPF